MSNVTLTSKRQATFPARMCAELNLAPGDVMEVEPAELAGERVWILRPRKLPVRPWLGCLTGKTTVTKHSMESIRASISAGRSRIES